MPHQECNPQNIAAKYRVKKIGEAEYELYAAKESASTISVRRRGAFLRFKTTPETVFWNAGETNAPFYVVTLIVTDLTIGSSGDEGWASELADNCMFVINGESLRHVPLTAMRILSETQFDIEEREIARMKGESPRTDPESGAVQDRPFARARVTHCPAQPEYGDSESLECTMGLPQATFEQLLDICLTGRSLTAHFHGIGGALSASFQYGEVRDLIFPAGTGFDINIDSVTFDCPCKSEPPMEREVEIAEIPTSTTDTEKILASLHFIAAGMETLRSTVIKVGWIMAVALLIAVVVK